MDQCHARNSAEYDTMEAHCEAYSMSLYGAYHQLSSIIRYEVGSQLALFVSNPARFHSQVALGVLVYLQGSKDHVFFLVLLILSFGPMQTLIGILASLYLVQLSNVWGV